MRESFRNLDENKKIDLIGLGNAIVDIIVNIEDEFLEINNLKKGSMNLINADESQALLKSCKVVKQISGGSSANTVVCLAQLGNNVQFVGRVKNDDFGKFFSSDIKKSNTIFNSPESSTSTAYPIPWVAKKNLETRIATFEGRMYEKKLIMNLFTLFIIYQIRT